MIKNPLTVENWSDGIVFGDKDNLNDKLFKLAMLWSLEGFKVTFDESFDEVNTGKDVHKMIFGNHHSSRRKVEVLLYGRTNKIATINFKTWEQGDLEKAFSVFQELKGYREFRSKFHIGINARDGNCHLSQWNDDFSRSAPIDDDRVLSFLEAVTFFSVY